MRGLSGRNRAKNLPRGMGSGRSVSRGKVVSIGGVWYFATWDSDGKIVHEDNGGSWRDIFDEAYGSVSAVRTIENAGHRLIRSYSYLVNHAPEEF